MGWRPLLLGWVIFPQAGNPEVPGFPSQSSQTHQVCLACALAFLRLLAMGIISRMENGGGAGCPVLHSCRSLWQQYSHGEGRIPVACPLSPPAQPRPSLASQGWPRRCVPFFAFLSLVLCPLQLQTWRSQGDRTMLVIAHRLHTVQNADQVLVLKQGQLVEHDQLRDEQDVYAHLVQQRLEA